MTSEIDRDQVQAHMARIQDNLAFVLKVHGKPAPNLGLHLAQAPIGLRRILDNHPGNQMGIEIGHKGFPIS